MDQWGLRAPKSICSKKSGALRIPLPCILTMAKKVYRIWQKKYSRFFFISKDRQLKGLLYNGYNFGLLAPSSLPFRFYKAEPFFIKMNRFFIKLNRFVDGFCTDPQLQYSGKICGALQRKKRSTSKVTDFFVSEQFFFQILENIFQISVSRCEPALVQIREIISVY